MYLELGRHNRHPREAFAVLAEHTSGNQHCRRRKGQLSFCTGIQTAGAVQHKFTLRNLNENGPVERNGDRLSSIRSIRLIVGVKRVCNSLVARDGAVILLMNVADKPQNSGGKLDLGKVDLHFTVLFADCTVHCIERWRRNGAAPACTCHCV